MSLSARITSLAELTLQDPAQATRALLAEGVPMAARTLGLLLVTVVSAFLVTLHLRVQSEPADPFVQAFMASPISSAVLQFLILSLAVVLSHWIGRTFGGRGSFADALLIMVWLQFLFLGPQVLQLLAEIVSPALAGIVALGSMVLFFWLFTACVTELHGFRSRGLVFLGVIGGGLLAGVAVVLVVLLFFGPEVLLPHV